jgi:uncharacterized protein YaeQ
MARHPSETEAFLLTRVIAYCLHYCGGMDLSPGLSQPDEPAIAVLDDQGRHRQWIEVGNPSRDRLERAARASDEVWVYSHRGTEQWLRGISLDDIRKRAHVTVVEVPGNFLEALAALLERRNRWGFVHSDRLLHLSVGDHSLEESLVIHAGASAASGGRA